jgi:hypothetical protein
MLVYAAWGARTSREVADRVDEVVRLLEPLARSRQVLIEMTLHPTRAPKLVVAHVLLSRLGYTDPEFDSIARVHFSASKWFRRDYPLSASTEECWIGSLWEVDSRSSDREVDSLSIFNVPSDMVGGSRDDAYAFTHLLFYLTDFGHRSHEVLMPLGSILLAEAEGLLARYLDAEDYDLSAEILMAWPLLGAPWSPAAAFAFRVLARVEDDAGVLPCGNVDVTRLKELRGHERTRYALATAYHTAFVMGCLCALCLRPGLAPPLRLSGPTCQGSRLAELDTLLSDDQGHWYPLVAECNKSEREAIVPLLFQLAVIQNVRKRDYGAIKQVLSLAMGTQLEEIPLWDQAAKLLLRIADTTAYLRDDDAVIT